MSQMQQEQAPVSYQPVQQAGASARAQALPNDGMCVLTIVFSAEYAYNSCIWIFNAKKELVVKPEEMHGHGFERSYLLATGNYVVRVEINGLIKDNEVDLYADKLCGVGIQADSVKQMLQTPAIYSSALLPRYYENKATELYESSHEYYTDAAIDASLMIPYSVSPDVTSSGIFIFLRYPTSEVFKETYNGKSYWEDFSLCNSKGESLVTFPAFCITDDNRTIRNYRPGSGFIGLSVLASPGMYYLKYSGTKPRMIPIFVYQNWYTQFFMMVADEPLYGSIRIFLSNKMVFNPLDENHIHIDTCLSKIQNGDYTIDEQLLDFVAYNKYDSPMLGLLGAYIYLFSKETSEDKLFRIITNNLQNKILINSQDSPDIWALNLLSYRHFNKTITDNEKAFINGTPMLRIAFDAVRNAAVDYPWLVPEGSVNDHVAENQVFDSPFNTFLPFGNMIEAENISFDLNNIKGLQIPLQEALSFSHSGEKQKFFSKETKEKLKSASSVAPELIGTTASAVINMINNNDKVSVDVIAKSLNLPMSTVSRIVKQVT